MIRKHILLTGLAISMCINQMPKTVFVKAASKQTSTFKVETNHGKASKYGYIKPAGQSYATNPKSKLRKASQLPSKFGSMDKSVRNQNPWGTCWAFAGIGSFEYAVDQKTGSDMDYSEEHMIQRLSKHGDTGYQITSKNTGGNEYMYSGYFASGMGPVTDGLFPYNTKDSLLQLTDSILNAAGRYRATDIQFFQTSDDENGALSSDTMNTVKEAVYENGSATCAIAWNSRMIQADDVSYYNSKNGARDETNHEILIVGWDDDYSADHFNGVTKNGAWLIRNSWGSNMGDNGYFWVSYQDKSLVPSCSIKAYEEVGDNDTIYNLDDGGALYPQITYGGYSRVGFLNSFSLKKREKLKEVTFYEAETGAKYQIFYVPIKEDGSPDIEKKLAITEKKTLTYPGYHTEKITQNINVKKAAIMVMIDSNEEDAGFGAEGSLSDGRKELYIPTLEKGQSYIYVDNELMDLYDMQADFGNWSIKLVTEKSKLSFYSKKYENIMSIGNFQWTGQPIKPEIGDIYSEDDNKLLRKGIDYEIEYDNNINPGTASVKVKGLNEYKDYSLTFIYTIYKTLQPTTEIKPDISDTTGTTTSDMTTATVITSKHSDTSKVNLKRAVIHNLKATKKSVIITIRKNENVQGYEICYSYKKNFKKASIKNLKNIKYKKVRVKKKNYTVTSYKLKGLKHKKNLYIKIRSYKQIGKRKIYSSWSPSKKIKVK